MSMELHIRVKGRIGNLIYLLIISLLIIISYYHIWLKLLSLISFISIVFCSGWWC